MSQNDWNPDVIYLNGLLWLPKSRFLPGQLDLLKAQLTYEHGDSRYKAVKQFVTFADRKTHLGIPRHFLSWPTVLSLGITVVDLRPTEYEKLDIESRVTLDSPNPDLDVQYESVRRLVENPDDGGLISLACGLGKTPTALHYWATYLKCPLLVVCDNTSILDQWQNMIRLFVSPMDLGIGRVFDGKKDWDKPVVLASTQSILEEIKKKSESKLTPDVRRRFGLVIYDEAHKLGAPQFSRTAGLFPGRRLGLTATHTRSDRLDDVFKSHIGKVLFEYLKQKLVPKFYFYTPVSSKGLMEDPLFRRNTIRLGELNVSCVWSELAGNAMRSQEIANIILSLVAEGRRVLVISQRKEMLSELNQRIPGSGVIIAKTKLEKRAKILAEAPVVLGIIQIAKEGLDSPTLDTFVACEPFKDANLFQQTIGRILRPGPKDPKVIVVADDLGDGAGPVYGLARAMKKVVETWPESKGGPYKWENFSL